MHCRVGTCDSLRCLLSLETVQRHRLAKHVPLPARGWIQGRSSVAQKHEPVGFQMKDHVTLSPRRDHARHQSFKLDGLGGMNVHIDPQMRHSGVV